MSCLWMAACQDLICPSITNTLTMMACAAMSLQNGRLTQAPCPFDLTAAESVQRVG